MTAFSARAWRSPLVWVLWGLTIAHIPLLLEHLGNLWNRPHYRFVVFVPVAAYVLWRRGGRVTVGHSQHAGTAGGLVETGGGTVETGSSVPPLSPLAEPMPQVGAWVPIVLWLAGLVTTSLLLSVGIWIHSPWIAAVSALWTVLWVSVAWAGMDGLRRVFRPYLMLVLLLPPPGNLDIQMVENLRWVSTWLSSALLNDLGVLHAVEGNVLEVPQGPLFVADACSGIHSLVVLMGWALFLGLMSQMGIIRVVVLAAVSLWIALWENAARVVLVTWAATKGWQWSTGYKHTLIGLFCFTCAVGAVWIVHTVLGYFGASRRWYASLNVERPIRVPPVAAVGFSRPLLATVAALFSMVLVALAGVQLWLIPMRGSYWQQWFRWQASVVPQLKEELSGSWNGWQLEEYQFVRRVLEDPFGEKSQVWTYRKGPILVRLSLDYPFPRMHNLANCYRAVGWRLTDRSVERMPTASASSPIFSVAMVNPTQGQAWLLFALFNSQGKDMPEYPDRLDWWNRLSNRLEQGAPWYQVQLLVEHRHELSNAERQECLRLFAFRYEQIKTCLGIPPGPVATPQYP